jgi:hypothetical protein
VNPEPSFIAASFVAQAFKSFAKLWRFQQRHRAALTDAGLRRWEIGEIASRVGQLYYAFYLRTGEGWYLSESHAFFDAAAKRDYFAECRQTPALSQKRLRHRARHVATCLLLDKLGEAREVVEAWRRDVDDYAADHRPADAAEWRALTDAAAAFVEADASGNAAGGSPSPSRRLARRAETAALSNPSVDVRKTAAAAAAAAPPASARGRRLGGVVLCGAYPSQVRFGDWALDAFRVHRACEWADATGLALGAGVGAATPAGSVASSPKGPPPSSHQAHHSRSRGASVSSAGSAFDASTPEGSSVAAESAGAPESGASDFFKHDDEEGKGEEGKDPKDPLGFATARIAPTPRKYAVRAASARQFLLAAATANEELGRDEMLLLYLSARGGADFAAGAEGTTNPGACPGVRLGTGAPSRGRGAGAAAGHFASLSVGGEVSLDGFPSRLVGDTARGGWAAAAAAPSAADADRRSSTALSSDGGRGGGTHFTRDASASRLDPDLTLYPADLVPLTRRRLFVVVDADAARQFHLLSGRGPCGPTPGGETPAVLAAPPSAPPRAPPESKNGRFFTLFLTDPAAGARALCGLSGPRASARERESPSAASDAERALESVAGALLEAEAAGTLHPAWSDAARDPFTRRFTAHFVLCRALVAAHATTKGDEEESGDGLSRFAPTCSPPLPASCDARACAPHAAAFVEALGLEREFRFA